MNVGDKVTLSKDSEFNPFGVIGTVMTVNHGIPHDSLNIIVDWGYYTELPYLERVTNSYNHEDLVVVE